MNSESLSPHLFSTDGFCNEPTERMSGGGTNRAACGFAAIRVSSADASLALHVLVILPIKSYLHFIAVKLAWKSRQWTTKEMLR
jgi:hypothetical protein